MRLYVPHALFGIVNINTYPKSVAHFLGADDGVLLPVVGRAIAAGGDTFHLPLALCAHDVNPFYGIANRSNRKGAFSRFVGQ